MAQKNSSSVPWNGSCESYNVYTPEKRPGFVAWVTAFPYGDGSYGLCFDETVEEDDPDFVPPKLEFGEAVGAPVSYGSVECGDPHRRSYRVYLRTRDGKTFTETGRCPRREGSFCAAGFPDGRILGFDVPKYNADGTGWSDCIRVRESTDGGATWTDVRQLLKGTAPYLWRVRRLGDGTIILLASLYGTPWGAGRQRATRNTMLPGETYQNKIQTFFMTTKDGRAFSGPHYILPGIGAHEYDVAEVPDGRLLFIAGDVQGTPVGRQFVTPSPDGWLNGTLYTIKDGAPPDPAHDPQGGYVPETMVWDEEQNCLIGYRRNKCYSLSNDWGENWVRVEAGIPLQHLYQPMMMRFGDRGRSWVELLGHVGGDAAFGQNDMVVDAHRLQPQCRELLPKLTSLSLERLLRADGSQYVNAFRAHLASGGEPLAGQEVVFRFNPYWNEDGSVNTAPQAQAPYQVRAVTDEDGRAEAKAEAFNGVADIHLSYNADVVYPGGGGARGCDGPMMTVLALTPRRRTLYPYDAYFAGGVLFLAPAFIRDFPGALEALGALPGDSDVLPEGVLEPAAVQRLAACGVLRRDGQRYQWIHSVHAPKPLAGVKLMDDGDWYE